MSIRTKINIASAASIILMLVCWFMNFGYYRMAFSFMFIPLWISILFFLGNNFAARYFCSDETVKKLTLASYPLFVVPHFIISDSIDSEPFFFFGLIENSSVSAVLDVVGIVIFFASVAVSTAQIVLYVIKKKKEKAA